MKVMNHPGNGVINTSIVANKNGLLNNKKIPKKESGFTNANSINQVKNFFFFIILHQ